MNEDLPVNLSLRLQHDLQSFLDDFALEFTADCQYIRWSIFNRRHPRNWSTMRKTFDMSVIIFLDLFATAVSTAGSAAASTARIEFHISQTRAIFLFLSLYLIGQAIGGVLFPPYSEAFGRKKLYVITTALYSIFCVVVAAVPSPAGVIVGRFVTGFLSATSTTVVVGSIEDMFNSKGRIWMVFAWAMVANLGLIIGPIMGTYITLTLGWRWLFYIAGIINGVMSLLLLFIRESRPSLLLVREVAKLQKATGIETLRPLNPDHTPSLHEFVHLALFRPLRLLFTEPIVFFVAALSALAYAMIYLFTEALPPIYEEFGFSPTSASLPFLAIGVGLLAGIPTRILDGKILARHRRAGHPFAPEHKLIGFHIGAPVLAGALWFFAWTIPPRVHSVHWIVSTVALSFVGYALNEFDTVLSGYLADSYLSYAASGFAALALLRASMSAAFPLFGGRMFDALDANVAVSVLAALATFFCFVPRIFSKYGEAIRARSKFAKHSLQVYRENGVDHEGY